MQISSHITELLYRYDCVIIPNFGAFISKRVPAHLDTSQQIMVPPTKRLSFNEQITNNDGLLTNYISTKELITFDIANTYVDQFVTDLRNAIQERSSLSLPKIGIFSTNEEGKLVFKPNTEVNYLKEAFGLEEVTANEVIRETFVTEEALEETPPIVAIEGSKRFKFSGVKYAASVALFVGVGGYLFWNQYKANEANQYTEASRLVRERVKEATFSIDIPNPLPSITLNIEKEEEGIEEIETPYHIVAGAFREKSNANTLIDRLNRKGYKAVYLGTNTYNLHQVAYKSFSDKVEAVRFLSKIKREENNTAWILTK